MGGRRWHVRMRASRARLVYLSLREEKVLGKGYEVLEGQRDCCLDWPLGKGWDGCYAEWSCGIRLGAQIEVQSERVEGRVRL